MPQDPAEPLANAPLNNASPTIAIPASNVLNNLELTSIIFSFLKDIALVEALLQGQSNSTPSLLAVESKRKFAELTRVNRAFFNASIGVLWETMDSLVPFFCEILPADRRKDCNELFRPLGYRRQPISESHWKRFEVYSAKTKTLILNQMKPPMDNAWVLHALSSKKRPDVLFPALRRLWLSSTDSLSLAVAFSIAPQVKFLAIHFDEGTGEEEEICLALLATLRQADGGPQDLTISQPITYTALRSLHQINSITCLSLRLPEGDIRKLGLRLLANLRSLKKLSLVQEVDILDMETANLLPLLNVDDPFSRAAKMPVLEELTVTGSGLTLFTVATELSPSALKALYLKAKADSVDKQVVLFPLIITAFALCNENMTSLSAAYNKGVKVKAETVEGFRGDLRYNQYQKFMDALSALKELTTLRILSIPFFDPGINTALFQLAGSLPKLNYFELFPCPMTTLSADNVVYPTLRDLQSISTGFGQLQVLKIACDLTSIPEIPKDYVSKHPLNSLGMFTLATMDHFTEDTLIALARYLHRLFPNLQELSRTHRKVGGDRLKLWSYLEKLLKSFQAIRAEAIQDMSMSTESAS
ncbi:hypothetical protein D9611_011213 [Ephemerocybe angulata]|uniref:Uncharacterized protein n=1 Tax=Ephemerocybe angulata TaxID=980116 RepID=A0A8H5FJ44_9AGAR|nr:hypothetical protein D9611_011213 [Tulosesus angulatus]